MRSRLQIKFTDLSTCHYNQEPERTGKVEIIDGERISNDWKHPKEVHRHFEYIEQDFNFRHSAFPQGAKEVIISKSSSFSRPRLLFSDRSHSRFF